MSDRIRETINEKLDRLASLDENWDAQGARVIDPTIIEAAKRFVARLPAIVRSPPAVVPMAKGNLQFEWHDGPRSLELEFESSATIHYLKWHTEEGVEEEGLFSQEETDRAAELLRWFVGAANVQR